MFERIMAWLAESGDEPWPRRAGGRPDELELAVAALLVEAASVDDHFGEGERRVIGALLARRFGLSSGDASALEAAAERRAQRSAQLFGFTRTINERWSLPQRVELIEMMWEVAYADGRLDPLEDALLRRVGGLVDVPDRERGEARLRVLQRTGRPDSG